MNIQATTQFAEGLPRRRFTVEDCFQLVESGIVSPDEKFELLGGEIVPMSPKGVKHEILKQWINKKLLGTLDDRYWVMVEPTIYLSDDTFVEPDIVVMLQDTSLEKFTVEQVLLAIEIANTTLNYDLGKKAEVCGVAGIREYWVVDATRLETHIHREPGEDGYRDISTASASAELVPNLLNEVSLKMDEFS
ncbi:MAG: Uma2 family endonuclease [Rhizobiaceae bacterium]|nr:Uma2 family endonuclease [Rhizobiaceae bacterium]